jgi:hypothetical protein
MGVKKEEKEESLAFERWGSLFMGSGHPISIGCWGGFRPKSTSFPSPVPMWRKACRRLDDEHVTPPLLPTGLEKFCLADLVPALEEEEEEEEQALSEFDPIPIHHVISVSR